MERWRCSAGLKRRHDQTWRCPRAARASAAHTNRDPHSYLWAPAAATRSGISQTQKLLTLRFLNAVILLFSLLLLGEDGRAPTSSGQCGNSNAGRMRVPDHNIKRQRRHIYVCRDRRRVRGSRSLGEI